MDSIVPFTVELVPLQVHPLHFLVRFSSPSRILPAVKAAPYPDSLSPPVPKFMPAVPNGPFDGLPLLYRNRMDGYELSTPGAEAKSPVTFTVNPAASARGK